MDQEIVIERVKEEDRRSFSLSHIDRTGYTPGREAVPPGGWGLWGEKVVKDTYARIKETPKFREAATPKLVAAMERSNVINLQSGVEAQDLDEFGRPPGVEISWNKIGEIIDKHGRTTVRPTVLPDFGPKVEHNGMLEYLLVTDRAKTFNHVENILYWEDAAAGEERRDPYLPKFFRNTNVYYHPSRYAWERGWHRTISNIPAFTVGDDCQVYGEGNPLPVMDLVFIVAEFPGDVLDRLCRLGKIDNHTGIYVLRNVPGVTGVWHRSSPCGVVLSRMFASCGNRATQAVSAGLVSTAANIKANISEMLSDNIMQVGWQALSRVRYVVVNPGHLLAAQKGEGIPWEGEGGPGGDVEFESGHATLDPSSDQFYPIKYSHDEDLENCDEIPVCIPNIEGGYAQICLSDDEMCGPPPDYHLDEPTRLLPGVRVSYPKVYKWSVEEITFANQVHGQIIHEARVKCGLTGSHLCALEAGRTDHLRVVTDDRGVPWMIADSVNRAGQLYPVPNAPEFQVSRDSYSTPMWNALRCPAQVAFVPLRIRATLEWPRLHVTLVEGGDLWASVRLFNYFGVKLGKVANYVAKTNAEKRAAVERAARSFVYPMYTVVWNILTHDLISNKKGRVHNRSGPNNIDRGWVHDYTTPPFVGMLNEELENSGRRIVYELIMTLIPCGVSHEKC